jgi:hypothetical protein
VSGDKGDGGGPDMSPIFQSYTRINMQYKNYFYETTKNEEMNDGNFFIFFCLHSKYSLRGFLRSIKIIHMRLKFLLCHDKNFYCIFLMQVLGNKYANAMQKVNMDKYRGTSRRGFGVFKSTEWHLATEY